MNESLISIDEFDYIIDKSKIANFPAHPRHNSKLLVHTLDNKIIENIFLNIDAYLDEGSILVFNNSKTIPARMFFKDKLSNGLIEIFYLAPINNSTFEEDGYKKKSVQFKALLGNHKKVKSTYVSALLNEGTNNEVEIIAKILQQINQQEFIVEMLWQNLDLTFKEILNTIGKMPLPPYIKRQVEKSDNTNYQNIFSKIDGSVATPTAGLHFSEKVFNALNKKNIIQQTITLHVGADTFKPVKETNILNHSMHGENFRVEKSFLETILNHRKKIFSVGTTTLRTLESLYHIGNKCLYEKQNFKNPIFIQQFEYAKKGIHKDFRSAIENIFEEMTKQKVEHLVCKTQLMILPNSNIKSIDALITNFHQPKSTLLFIIKSVAKDAWKNIYNYALKNNFRFFSYGDACLIFNKI